MCKWARENPNPKAGGGSADHGGGFLEVRAAIILRRDILSFRRVCISTRTACQRTLRTLCPSARIRVEWLSRSWTCVCHPPNFGYAFGINRISCSGRCGFGPCDNFSSQTRLKHESGFASQELHSVPNYSLQVFVSSLTCGAAGAFFQLVIFLTLFLRAKWSILHHFEIMISFGGTASTRATILAP